MADNAFKNSQLFRAFSFDSDNVTQQLNANYLNLLRSAGNPDDSDGLDGNMYLNTNDNGLWVKTGGSWVAVTGGSANSIQSVTFDSDSRDLTITTTNEEFITEIPCCDIPGEAFEANLTLNHTMSDEPQNVLASVNTTQGDFVRIKSARAVLNGTVVEMFGAQTDGVTFVTFDEDSFDSEGVYTITVVAVGEDTNSVDTEERTLTATYTRADTAFAYNISGVPSGDAGDVADFSDFTVNFSQSNGTFVNIRSAMAIRTVAGVDTTVQSFGAQPVGTTSLTFDSENFQVSGTYRVETSANGLDSADDSEVATKASGNFTLSHTSFAISLSGIPSNANEGLASDFTVTVTTTDGTFTNISSATATRNGTNVQTIGAQANGVTTVTFDSANFQEPGTYVITVNANGRNTANDSENVSATGSFALTATPFEAQFDNTPVNNSNVSLFANNVDTETYSLSAVSGNALRVKSAMINSNSVTPSGLTIPLDSDFLSLGSNTVSATVIGTDSFNDTDSDSVSDTFTIIAPWTWGGTTGDPVINKSLVTTGNSEVEVFQVGTTWTTTGNETGDTAWLIVPFEDSEITTIVFNTGIFNQTVFNSTDTTVKFETAVGSIYYKYFDIGTPGDQYTGRVVSITTN